MHDIFKLCNVMLNDGQIASHVMPTAYCFGESNV